MTEARAEDVVLTLTTADGRFVDFTRTDVRPGWLLPWWGVVADTGGDGFGLLVRLDAGAAPDGWTGRQLLLVVRRRVAAEHARRPLQATRDALHALDRAAACAWGDAGTGASEIAQVAFCAVGGAASPYPWTVACRGDASLPLCPDPESREEGVTPEQLLIVLAQLLLDAARARPHASGLWLAYRHAAAALAAELRRLAELRA